MIQAPLYLDYNNPIANPLPLQRWEERVGRSNGQLHELIVHIFQTNLTSPPYSRLYSVIVNIVC